MRSTAFWHSSAMRTALLYFGLYTFASLLSFTVLYFSAGHDLRSQNREAVEQDVRALTTIYREQGREALINNITVLSNSVEAKRSLYLLQAADGTVIAGNAAHITPFEDWKELSLPFRDHTDHFYIFGAVLGDMSLFVGRRAHNITEIQESIRRAIGVGFGITIPLVLIGIFILARRNSARVDRIAGEMEAYIDGDLTRRVPIQGRHDEVDRLAGNINTLLSRIEKLISSLKQVTSDVAHDLRTPLSRLRQRLEATSGAAPGGLAAIGVSGQQSDRSTAVVTLLPAGENTIERAIGEVDAIIETFDALLQIAELDAGSKLVRTAAADLYKIAQFLAETYASVAEDRGQQLSFHGDDDASVAGDRRLLTQLTANLLENALRHTPQGSRVDLSVTRTARSVELRIADSGPGIPPDERDKVFDRFYRLDTSRTTPGSGLGLALVKAVADLHGATISLADNHPGLIVTVAFPA
ncbi:MAG TPA: HAMP domain-containing sensor histidine kinase [Terriglobales bacterium]|nr:HAMP domain-containing sensor histidine kinase [Terriglobales bacterium]